MQQAHAAGDSFDVPEAAFSLPYMTLMVGDVLRLEWRASAEAVKFLSSVPKVAVVSDAGVVTALTEGMTIIALETADGGRASLTLRVRDPKNPLPG
ncbi:MAG: hypothetical protein LBP21_02005 [Synergistaceae bacterium]|nr:hypothetical protein [Synergistaceae bacterium]